MEDVNGEREYRWGVDTIGVCPGCSEPYEMFTPLRRYRVETRVSRIAKDRFRIVAVVRRKRVLGLPLLVGEVDLHRCEQPGGSEADPLPAFPSDRPPTRTIAAECDLDDD